MKKKIYEILRNYVARRATGNLGKVEILEDKIICYVEGRKLKKKEKYIHRYELIFKCIPLKDEIYKIYNLEKPVYYIIYDVKFDREINIRASVKNCHVFFENCTFTGAVEIDFADHITFINNTYKAQNYKNFRSIHKEGEFCISTRTNKNEINKIEFINDNIDIEYPETISTSKQTNPNLQIWLYAKEIFMTTTDIVGAKSFDIGADKLCLVSLDIISEETEINTKELEANSSTIKSDIISITTDDYSCLRRSLKCNNIFINGIEINKNESNINEETLKLQKQRLELISSLKKIQRHTEEQISQEIKKEPLTRVLKK